MVTDTVGELIVPLHAEQIVISHKAVETGRVSVSTSTTTHDVQIDELLTKQQVFVERVQVGKFVSAMPCVREEGDTTIIPVVEEVFVTERRLFLKEEVRVRRVTTEHRHQEVVTLRREEATVNRQDIPRD